MQFSQLNREVTVQCGLPDGSYVFESMTTVEELSRLPEFHVAILASSADTNGTELLFASPLDVRLQLADASLRHFQGIVATVSHDILSHGVIRHNVVVHPWLWLLKKKSDSRIFQDLTAEEILKKVCAKYATATPVNVFCAPLPKLPYCVQYRETDFDFVCRVLEEAGVFFYFTYDASGATMVLADAESNHPRIRDAAFPVRHASEARPLSEESFTDWNATSEQVIDSYVLDDFSPMAAVSSTNGGLRASAKIAPISWQPASTNYELVDYPGRYDDKAAGDALAKARLLRLQAPAWVNTATTDARSIYPGGVFMINTQSDIAASKAASTLLATRTAYTIVAGAYTSGAANVLDVSCQVHAAMAGTPYLPPAVAPRPVVPGPHTAMVVGEGVDEICTDALGRIRVEFHWDRIGPETRRDAEHECWLRVAQGWAGQGWGAQWMPRVGMEVVVSFLEGNPDRPIVTGCVYNSDAKPPYALPEHQTVSTIQSRSSTGGGGFNELRFQDLKDKEQLFMHAQRDFLRVVKNDDVLKVGYDLPDDEHKALDPVRPLKGDQTISIKNDQTITIGHNATETVKGDQKLDVTGQQDVKVGKTIVIEAGTSIELKVGSSSIKIEAGKITIKSAEIEIAADANAKVSAGAMMEVKAGATMDIKASAPMTIAGAMVQIN